MQNSCKYLFFTLMHTYLEHTPSAVNDKNIQKTAQLCDNNSIFLFCIQYRNTTKIEWVNVLQLYLQFRLTTLQKFLFLFFYCNFFQCRNNDPKTDSGCFLLFNNAIFFLQVHVILWSTHKSMRLGFFIFFNLILHISAALQ